MLDVCLVCAIMRCLGAAGRTRWGVTASSGRKRSSTRCTLALLDTDRDGTGDLTGEYVEAGSLIGTLDAAALSGKRFIV